MQLVVLKIIRILRYETIPVPLVAHLRLEKAKMQGAVAKLTFLSQHLNYPM
jgi:hypothetical protein